MKKNKKEIEDIKRKLVFLIDEAYSMGKIEGLRIAGEILAGKHEKH